MGYTSWESMERKRKRRKVLLILLLLLLLIAAAVGGYWYYTKWKADKQQQNYEDLKKKAFSERENEPTVTPIPGTPTPVPTEEDMLLAAMMEEYEEFFTILPDFDILHGENEDVFAYIAVPDTIIDYPILASEKEDYYLSHNIDHTKGYPGCLYIQNCNNRDMNDPFTIVYGHNMKNGTMFGSLKNYVDTDFRNTHPYFFIYMEDRVMVYEVTVVSYMPTEHLLSEDYVKKSGKWVFEKFDGHETSRLLEKAREEDEKAYIASPEPTDTDTTLVLSTCGAGKRFVVVGTRVLSVPIDQIPAPKE
ncbi:MAG: class B sortase [Lachnospiraceae bacterium]|nr:class B sortase [Lachnospiraceae bacterium]